MFSNRKKRFITVAFILSDKGKSVIDWDAVAAKLGISRDDALATAEALKAEGVIDLTFDYSGSFTTYGDDLARDFIDEGFAEGL